MVARDILQKRNVPIALPSTGLEEWEATRECFETGWLTQGPKVAAFEKAFTLAHHAKHSLAVTSCTTGLHLALAAIGIGPGDEVIVPSFTWVATANIVLHCGATPVFADIDPLTFNIDPLSVKQKLTERTKAVIPVHLFGLCADVDAVRSVLPDDVAIIEDAACAAGAVYKGRKAGTLGLAGVFSLHPRKSITTGEGGMITTNDDTFAERAGKMRNHGAEISEEQRHAGPKPYLLPEFNLLGFNYRMTDLQGAVGLVQLAKLDGFIEERQRWAEYYMRELQPLEWLRLPKVPDDCRHGWQSFVCYIDPEKAPASRNDLMEKLQAQGISTRPGTHAVHMLGYYQQRFGTKPEDCPAACDAYLQSLAIPLHNRMTAEDYQYVVEVLKSL
ncbi:MAG: DegT/DnrJ/EryC1/StrS family aminotransferase [Vampirovibrionales bacterium]|nr:DegT/DnrJ/EryC1/StrS family aminotransferase [Vampirovibrionales bacterium]